MVYKTFYPHCSCGEDVYKRQADSVFALVAEQAPDSYLGDMWRARTHSAMDLSLIHI